MKYHKSHCARVGDFDLVCYMINHPWHIVFSCFKPAYASEAALRNAVWSIRKAPMDTDRFTSHGTTYKHKFSCESPLSYTSQSGEWSKELVLILVLSKVALCSISAVFNNQLHRQKKYDRYLYMSTKITPSIMCEAFQRLEAGFEVSKTTLNYVFLRRRHWSSQKLQISPYSRYTRRCAGSA